MLERILMRLTGKEIVPVWFVTVLEYSKASSSIPSISQPNKGRVTE
jgi:hypothetical protein